MVTQATARRRWIRHMEQTHGWLIARHCMTRAIIARHAEDHPGCPFAG